MGKTIKQIYDANPSTSAAPNDLIYLGQYPYTSDSAIKKSDLTVSILTNYTPTESYVSTAGLDTNTGQITQPFLTINQASTSASANTKINVASGTFSKSSGFNLRPNVSIAGSGAANTTFNITGGLSVNQSEWTASTAPVINLNNINIFPDTISLTPTTYKSGSAINISNSNLYNITTDCNISNLDNLSVINSSISNLVITDINNVVVTGGSLAGTMSINTTGSSNHTSMNIIFTGVDFKAGTLNILNQGSIDVPLHLYFRSCKNIATISYDDAFNGYTTTIDIDLSSIPASGFTILADNFTTITTDNIQYADTTKGFANSLDNMDFGWGGNTGFANNNYTLWAGLGAHRTTGNNNILLGNYSTSSRNGCFVWSDGSTTAGTNHFPASDNQALFYAAGGFGIGAPSNSPKAGFHYGNDSGNDGKFLFSAIASIPTGSMANNEINPYVWTVGSYSGMAVNLKDGGGNFYMHNLTPYPASPVGYATTTVTLSASDLLGGATVFTGSSAQTANMPTASALDAALVSKPVGYKFYWTIVNQGSNTLTINGGTNLSLTGMATYVSGTATIAANKSSTIMIYKTAPTPAYACFGG